LFSISVDGYAPVNVVVEVPVEKYDAVAVIVRVCVWAAGVVVATIADQSLPQVVLKSRPGIRQMNTASRNLMKSGGNRKPLISHCRV